MIKKHVIYILAILVLGISQSFAQDKATARKALKRADIALETLDYLNAYNLYLDVIKNDTTNYDAIYKAGYCLLSINKSDTASINYFLKAKDIKPESHFYLGRCYLLQGERKKALEEFYFFTSINHEESIPKTEVEHWIKITENAVLSEIHKEDYHVKNMGAKINSSQHDYVPLLLNNEQSLVFTSRRAGGMSAVKDPYGAYYEDIYISNLENDTAWTEPQVVRELSTLTHDACVSISPNGKEMLIYRTDESQMAGDLYLCKYEDGKWQAPEKLSDAVNSSYLEASACFTPDEGVIIFSSNRPGGYGGKDLYKATKFMNGEYSLPQNLGPSINTSDDEDAPFMAADNVLYFSSKGYNTMGEYDIFQTSFNEELNKWNTPENLGFPINSSSDDIYYIKNTDGKKAFFSSNRIGGFGMMDLYEINFTESEQLVIKGQLIADSDMLKNETKISLYDNTSGNLEGLYHIAKGKINFVLVAKKDKAYKILVENDDIAPLIIQKTFSDTTKDLKISPNRKRND